MNNKIKILLNLMIVIAAIVFLAMLINMNAAIRYAHRDTEDPVESAQRQMAYKVSHRAYGEVVDTYYWKRSDYLEPPEGMEDLYHVAAYAHAAFMSRVYEESKDEQAVRENAEKMERLKKDLGAYAFSADEVDAMIKKAP
ncbi:MAG: hypothetical protein K6E18_09200 [Lachnospiraceae bacterium]|nr:hypothetical protein [Lachnospiraceae bacterium]